MCVTELLGHGPACGYLLVTWLPALRPRLRCSSRSEGYHLSRTGVDQGPSDRRLEVLCGINVSAKPKMLSTGSSWLPRVAI
jgi:hypothetical protein